MYSSVSINYCSDTERYHELLKSKDILAKLRVPISLHPYLNNIILTEQITSKRGLMKLITVIYKGEDLDIEALKKSNTAFNKILMNVQRTNMFTTVCMFGNNLIQLLKLTECVVSAIKKLQIYDAPKVNISSDLDIEGISYICHDIAAFFNIIQLTAVNQQQGDVFLKVTDLSDDYIAFILLACINVNGKIKIHLLSDGSTPANDLDLQIWKCRGIEALQNMNVNIDFSVLDDIVDNKG